MSPSAAAGAPVARRSWAHLRGLVWTLVRTDFKMRYHGTLGGFVWALAKPVAMFVVLVAIFSFIFEEDPHYKLDLVIGLFLWDFFSEGTRAALGSLHAKGFLLTKARFPSWLVVVASTSNAVVTLAVFAVSIVAFVAVTEGLPAPSHLALFAAYLGLYFVVVLAVGFATSAPFLRYRDLNQVWDVVLQAGFFVAPIIYPLGILPEVFHALLYLWPPTPIIEFSRAVLIDGAPPTVKAHLLLVACVAALLGASLVVHRAFAPRAAEYL